MVSCSSNTGESPASNPVNKTALYINKSNGDFKEILSREMKLSSSLEACLDPQISFIKVSKKLVKSIYRLQSPFVY